MGSQYLTVKYVKGVNRLNKYYVVDKSHYTENWLLLTLLFVGAILAWWQISSLLAAVLAGLGFIIMLVNERQGKKKNGNSIEVLEKCIIFNEDGQSRSVAFNEIKKVKFSNGLTLRDSSILIETGINKHKIQPSQYENSDKLLQQLQNKFTAFNCKIVK
jgi:hypothetical protein